MTIAGVIAIAGMIGPFQGAERLVSLTDKEAHVVAFYVLTTLSFLAAPRRRKADLAAAALLLAAFIEVAQGAVGRETSLADLMAGSLGVLMAWAPAKAEVLRRPRQKDRRRTTAARMLAAKMAAAGAHQPASPVHSPQ